MLARKHEGTFLPCDVSCGPVTILTNSKLLLNASVSGGLREKTFSPLTLPGFWDAVNEGLIVFI